MDSFESRLSASWRRYVALYLVLTGVALVLGFLPAQSTGSILTLSDGWQYRWSDRHDVSALDESLDAPGWTAIVLPAHPPSSAENVLWLRREVPRLVGADQVIAFDAVTAPFEAYVGSERVHVHPSPEGLSARAPAGLPWQLIRLPADAAGQTFSLRIRAAGQGTVVRGMPMLGSRADLLTWTLERDLPRLAAGLLAVLMGIFGLVVLIRRGDWRLPVSYALSTSLLGLYIIVYTHVKDLLFDAPRLWFAIWLVVVPTMPIATLVFLDGVFGATTRVLRVFARVHVVYAAALVVSHSVSFTLYAVGEPALEWLSLTIFTFTLQGLRVLILLSTLSIAVVLGRFAVRGDPEARIYMTGFALQFALGMRDLLAAFGVASLSWKSQIHIGFLALAGAYALILSRRYAAAHERAAAFALEVVSRAREKERLLRDLHDGVGSLTSNVRVLAELGQRHGDRAQRSLATIAELSGTALAELRSFVQALDDTHLTWELLVAELRRYGASIVETAGASFEMTSSVEADGRPPGLLSLNLLRIFRESLANALKQESIQVVKVELEIHKQGLHLRIRNDGGDGARRKAGLDTRRGLGNMRARAEELGGTLEVLVGTETVSELRVPLPMRAAAPPP